VEAQFPIAVRFASRILYV